MIPATDTHALTLAQWLSPAFPVGAFAYSHGLEWAITQGRVHDAASLREWLTDLLVHGSGKSDAIVLTCAYTADTPEAVAEIDASARAFAPSSERLMETDLQGAAFSQTLADVWHHRTGPLCYPVALGRAARLHGLPLALTARMYLHAFASNLTSAAVRLVPLGQTDGQRVLSALTPLCASVAGDAMTRTLDDLTSSTFASDIASMRHETQTTRLFRT